MHYAECGYATVSVCRPSVRLSVYLSVTPANVRMYFIFLETRIIGLHFAADSMNLSSFKFFCRAPSLQHGTELKPVKEMTEFRVAYVVLLNCYHHFGHLGADIVGLCGRHRLAERFCRPLIISSVIPGARGRFPPSPIKKYRDESLSNLRPSKILA